MIASQILFASACVWVVPLKYSLPSRSSADPCIRMSFAVCTAYAYLSRSPMARSSLAHAGAEHLIELRRALRMWSERARMIPLSVLDLAPIVQGGDAAQAFRHSRDLAQHIEAWGYRRFWLAEHHGMPGSRARRRRSSSRTSPLARRASVSAPAASCCRTTHRSSSLSSSARSIALSRPDRSRAGARAWHPTHRARAQAPSRRDAAEAFRKTCSR